MKFFYSKVTLEKSDLQTIPELNFLVLQKRTLFFGTSKIFEAVYSTVVLSTILLFPLHSDPKLSFTARGFSWVEKRPEVPDDACRVVEEDFSADKIILMLLIEVL